jgi:hypothetical protein
MAMNIAACVVGVAVIAPAIDLDPTFTGGYSGLAAAYMYAANTFGTRSLLDVRSPIEALARRAVALDRLLEESLGTLIVIGRKLAEVPQAALIGGPGVEAFWPLAQGALLLGIGDGRAIEMVTAPVISSGTAKMSARLRS